MNDTTSLKCCSRKENCVHPDGPYLPATTEYFHAHKEGKYGLRPDCKICAREYARAYRQANRDVITEKQREWYQANQDKEREHQRKYYQVNQDKKREYAHKYRQANPEYAREYKQAYKPRRLEKYRANPEKGRILSSRYRARKRNLPDTFTPEQWQACLEYHNHCCAVCGKQLYDLWGEVEPHADHWIPITYNGDDNPGTVVENMICLCNHCNSSKSAKMPYDWLKEQFGTRQANAILARVNAYFEQVKLE